MCRIGVDYYIETVAAMLGWSAFAFSIAALMSPEWLVTATTSEGLWSGVRNSTVYYDVGKCYRSCCDLIEKVFKLVKEAAAA